MAKKTDEPQTPGRKPRAGEATSMVGIRLTDSERGDYERAAKATKVPGKDGKPRSMTLAEWIRYACAALLNLKKGKS